MTERFSIEGVRERVHLDDDQRLDRDLPPKDMDITYLLAEIEQRSRKVALAMGFDLSPAEKQLAETGDE